MPNTLWYPTGQNLFYYTGGSTSTSTSSLWPRTSTSSLWPQISVTGSINQTSVYYRQPDGSWVSSGDLYRTFQTIRQKPRTARDLRRPRGAIKRAMSLLSGLGYEHDMKLFLGHNDIEVSHEHSPFKFVIRKGSRDLVRYTEFPGNSTPYDLSLCTKDDVHVADLCVYMENTPVLDQVAGVMMFIRSGEEEHILKNANWRNRTQDVELCASLVKAQPYLGPKMRLNHS